MCLHVHPLTHTCALQAAQEGPVTPEDFVHELKKFSFHTEGATELQESTIDKLRVSLSTNGLR